MIECAAAHVVILSLTYIDGIASGQQHYLK